MMLWHSVALIEALLPYSLDHVRSLRVSEEIFKGISFEHCKAKLDEHSAYIQENHDGGGAGGGGGFFWWSAFRHWF